MPKRSSKRPKDINQLAKFIVDVVSGEVLDEYNDLSEHKKNPAAVELGRLGGLKGGKARAVKLTATQRRKIARNAANKRWKNKNS